MERVNDVPSTLTRTIACPLCGGSDYEVKIPSKYPPGITAEELARFYSASSDHQLLDQMVACRGCGFLYVNPRPLDEIIVGGYTDAVDPAFAAQNDERIKTFRSTVDGIVSRLQMNPKGLKLLDVGCAAGAFPKAARDAGFDAMGIEPSNWLAEYGRKEYGLDVRQGLLGPGTFPSATFDLVSLWDVIEHVPDPNEILATILDILKPGGYLLVNYPDIGSLVARTMGGRWPFLLSVHLWYYTRETMRRQLEKAQYEVIYMKPHWQTLQLGYVVKRASAYVGPIGWISPALKAVGLDHAPFTYNMGQTLVVARKKG